MGQYLVQSRFTDAKNQGIFYRLDIELGGDLIPEAVMVRDPPVFDTKVGDLFYAFFIDEKDPETTLYDKILMPAQLVTLDNKIFVINFLQFQRFKK